ncbi:MAG: hypothetical protein ACM65M_04320 [Microcoleus sp.]
MRQGFLTPGGLSDWRKIELSDSRTGEKSNCRTLGLAKNRTVGLSDWRKIELSDYRTGEKSNWRKIELSDDRTGGLSD